MEKINRTLVFAMIMAALGFASCGADAEKSVSGIIIDGTMNTVMLTTEKGDTLVFSTVDADKTAANGMLIGDSIRVYYKGKLNTTQTGDLTPATRVFVTHAERPSDKLIGSWVEPVPGMPGQLQFQGVKMDKGGAASSINMATLKYNAWEMMPCPDGCSAPGMLILNGESIGNGQTIMFADTMNILKLDADSLVLSKGGYTVRYAKQK